MLKIFKPLLTLTFTLLASQTAFAADENTFAPDAINQPMTFINAHNGGNCFGCEWIAAEGYILAETPAKFKKFMTENFSNDLQINSKGGDLDAALELGKLFRDYKLSTNTGKTWIDKNSQSYKDGFKYHEVADGICAGACSYAFLGGVSRQPVAGNFGINYLGPTDVSNQQIQNYISQMGIKPELATTIFDQAANNDYFPTSNELIAWGVDNVTDQYSTPQLVAYGKNNGKLVETKHLSGLFAKPSNPRSYRLYCRGKDKTPHFTIIENYTNGISNQQDDWGKLVEHITTANIQYNSSQYTDTKVKIAAYFNGKNSKALAFELQNLPLDKFKDIKSISIALYDVPREYMFVINQLQADFGNVNELLGKALQNCVE